MDLRLFFTVFGTVLLAEIGDKTQLATLLYATGSENSKITVFLGSALALVCASGVAVLVGLVVAKYVSPKHLSWMAGLGFIAVGVWTIIKGLQQ